MGDVDDNWKESVHETVLYLEDKFLLSFILASRIIHLQPYVKAACDPDEESWPFRKFFLEVKYWDTDVPETAKKSVVGRCFWLSCTLGMDTAVESLLYLSSLKPGWWMYYRVTVLNGARVAASDHNLSRLDTSIPTNRSETTTYTMPALARHSLQESSSQILRYEDRWKSRVTIYGRATFTQNTLSDNSFRTHRRSSYRFGTPFQSRLDSSPPPRNGATQQVVTSTVCKILHYLEGHSQPLDTGRAKRLDDMSQCRAASILQNQSWSSTRG